MYFENVDINDIDLEDRKYHILSQTDSEKLQLSIEEIGLINPIKLIKNDNTYTVVTGWERLSVLTKLNFKYADANIYEKNELPNEAIYKLIYTDNKHRADDLFKAELLNRIHRESKYSQNELIDKILKYFDLNPSINNLNKYIAIAELSTEIKSSFMDDRLSFEQLHMLCEIKNTDERLEIFKNFLIKYKFNNNETRDLIKDLLIIKQREKIGIKKIAGIVKENLNDKVNKNDLRIEIKKICYPKLMVVENLYRERLKDLKLPDNIRLVNHPYFESNDLEVRIKFKSSEKLSDAIKNLESNLSNGNIDKLLRVVKKGN